MLQLHEPVWFSYYGPIQHPETSEALEAAITSHLHDIGSCLRIPIRKETPEQITVRIGLEEPPFTTENGLIIVHFVASAPGCLTFESNHLTDVQQFPVGNGLTYAFEASASDRVTLRFDFPYDPDASGRLFRFEMTERAVPTIVDDTVLVNGIESSVTRVYLGDGNGFTDGLCLMCCCDPVTVIAYPCRHCCMCRACSQKFAGVSNYCPVCRAPVAELIDCGSLELMED
jgi:hypothetical protein